MESAIVVYEVPPCEAPKQLTARFRPLNLKEHFMAFLCANNPSGFLPDLADALPGETIGDLMLLVATHDGVSLSHLKSYARKVKRASCAVIGHSRALDLLSALFGYRDYCEAYREFQKSGWLANRRDKSSINMKIFAVPRARE